MAQAVLVAAYSLHMAATAVWIGGLAFLTLFLPAAARRLPERERRSLVEASSRRFRPFAWICLAVFAATGLMQMSASPRYQGLLTVGNLWSGAILAKHLLVFGMAAILAYQTWVLQPRLERTRLGAELGGPEGAEADFQRDGLLHRLSLALGSAVLLLTAVARTSA